VKLHRSVTTTREDNKKVATNCGESEGEAGQIPFLDGFPYQKYEFSLESTKFVLFISDTEPYELLVGVPTRYQGPTVTQDDS